MTHITRRNFLKIGMRTCLYSFITSGIGYYYAKYIEPHFISFTQHTLKSQLIPKSFHGMKILQFSDLHLGYYFSLQHLSQVVSKINAVNPDIVLFTGDLIDNYQTYTDTPFVASILKNIQAPSVNSLFMVTMITVDMELNTMSTSCVNQDLNYC